MNVNELTIGQAREISRMVSCADDSGPYKIGQAYLIRTVTHYYTGRLIRVGPQELVIEDAAWIADTGRFHNAIKDGKLNEVEPLIGPVIIGRGSIVEATEWQHPLPDKQK